MSLKALNALPYANDYLKSYSHGAIVTHLAHSLTGGYLVTGSADGCLKIWDKKPNSLECTSSVKCQGPIQGLSVSVNGKHCCAIYVKDLIIYDVQSRCTVKINLLYEPACVECFCEKGNPTTKIVVTARYTDYICFYDISGSEIISIKMSHGSITAIKFNQKYGTLIYAYQMGMLDYMDSTSLKFPDDVVKFKLRLDTDLFDILKDKSHKTTVSSIEVSPDGEQFSVTSHDSRIRVFWFGTGKLRRVYDESLEAAKVHTTKLPLCRLAPDCFKNRVVIEEQIEKTKSVPRPNAVFDESSEFLIYATLHGIKIVNLSKDRVTRILGKMECGRFLRIALYQSSDDPILLCCAFNMQRIYMFSQNEPEETPEVGKGRDV